ncbi:MAG: 50S ribosomal protein L17 [Bacteroidales bacterium]|nr:50S ribosomal protein L17 [Bacteroidales bacterium]
MRHGCKVNKLSRTHAHRVAMLSNMASSLILHKRIETTLAKARALRGYVEPLITKSKTDSTHQRRIVFSYLQNKEAVTELFREVSGKVATRNGGYTRILKVGRRLGDGAEMVMMELVDYNENLLKEAKTEKAKTTRRGRAKKSETVETANQQAKIEEPAVAQVEEEVKVGETPASEEKAE